MLAETGFNLARMGRTNGAMCLEFGRLRANGSQFALLLLPPRVGRHLDCLLGPILAEESNIELVCRAHQDFPANQFSRSLVIHSLDIGRGKSLRLGMMLSASQELQRKN